jgi:ABC-2 type transport system permease protein
MSIVLLLIQKELLQILRNKAMIPILLLGPLIQLIILSYSATQDIKNLALAVLDSDHSTYSRLLVDKMTASGYFKLQSLPATDKEAFDELMKGKADLVLTIPHGFERGLLRKEAPGNLQLLINAINGQKAGLSVSYANRVIQQFGVKIVNDIQLTPVISRVPHQIPQVIAKNPMGGSFSVTWSNWYNPTLDYKMFMVPGILGELVAMLVLVLSAMNVVREKEIGTIEQINVTPIKKWQFILGKLLPFLLIGLVLLTIGLTAGKLIFDIPMVGSLWVVFLFCVVNIFCVLGVGFFISNFADTQQQAMFIAWFFMVIFILMSGLFTPIESMPMWAQALTVPNPIAHFVTVMRLVLMKGSSLADVSYNFLVMIIMGFIFNGLAVWTYQKRVA